MAWFAKCNRVAYDVCLAVLGSAGVAFLLMCGEYLVERRRALKLYCDEALRMVIIIGRVNYLDLSEYGDLPISMVIDCLTEDVRNERPIHGWKRTNKARNAFFKYLEDAGCAKIGECDKCREKSYASWMAYFRRVISEFREGVLNFCEYAETNKRH